MDTLSTILALLIPVLALGAAAWAALYARQCADEAHGWYLKAEASAMRLRSERDRTTTVEREVDSLRRELRKLSGKFHASQETYRAPPAPDEEQLNLPNLCENWQLAQTLGPRSDAASCECGYCVEMRKRRAIEKAAILKLQQQGAPRRIVGEVDEHRAS